ncbi:MAG TPA: PEP-CTERM sorting domain-containing protein [Bryobacteraceae bacterium]|jgi:hypothetical protein
MILKNASRVLGALASVFLLHGVASAAAVGTGLFNLAGTVLVTDTSFLFGYSTLPTKSSADQNAVAVLPATGAFAGLHAGDLETIHNLLTPTNGPPFGPGPVVPGTSFTLAPFVELTTLGIDLDLTGPNPLPISPAPVCSGTSFDSPGDLCRARPGSPVTLEQGRDGVTAIMNLDGVAHFTGSSDNTVFFAKFSASFGGAKISQLINDLNTQGFVRTGYQASFITIPVSTVPEPASMALIGAGLFALGFFGKKRLVK